MSVFEWVSIGKEFGLSGLILLVAWMMVDKWATQFLAAQEKQATAMTSLADGLRTLQSDQRDVLMAVQVQSTELRDVKEALHEMTAIWGRGKESHDVVKS
jgi:hypothetical protein